MTHVPLPPWLMYGQDHSTCIVIVVVVEHSCVALFVEQITLRDMWDVVQTAGNPTRVWPVRSRLPPHPATRSCHLTLTATALAMARLLAAVACAALLWPIAAHPSIDLGGAMCHCLPAPPTLSFASDGRPTPRLVSQRSLAADDNLGGNDTLLARCTLYRDRSYFDTATSWTVIQPLPPLPVFDPTAPLGATHRPPSSWEHSAALAARCSYWWTGDRPSTQARPGLRDPAVAGGDSFVASSPDAA